MPNTGFFALAARRYSVRAFEDRPVARETLQRILDAGRLAPTACNRQPQRILVIDSDESIQKLRKCTHCHFGARTALLICYDKTACWVNEFNQKPSGDIDASIVTTHMMLQAAELGVGSTWVMYYIPEAIREEFELPEAYEPTALLILGYPAPNAKPSPLHSEFRPMNETVFDNRFA